VDELWDSKMDSTNRPKGLSCPLLQKAALLFEKLPQVCIKTTAGFAQKLRGFLGKPRYVFLTCGLVV